MLPKSDGCSPSWAFSDMGSASTTSTASTKLITHDPVNFLLRSMQHLRRENGAKAGPRIFSQPSRFGTGFARQYPSNSSGISALCRRSPDILRAARSVALRGLRLWPLHRERYRRVHEPGATIDGDRLSGDERRL